jgi:hypothetical protein
MFAIGLLADSISRDGEESMVCAGTDVRSCSGDTNP